MAPSEGVPAKQACQIRSVCLSTQGWLEQRHTACHVKTVSHCTAVLQALLTLHVTRMLCCTCLSLCNSTHLDRQTGAAGTWQQLQLHPDTFGVLCSSHRGGWCVNPIPLSLRTCSSWQRAARAYQAVRTQHRRVLQRRHECCGAGVLGVLLRLQGLPDPAVRTGSLLLHDECAGRSQVAYFVGPADIQGFRS